MKIKVVRGSIKYDNVVYAIGKTLDLPEKSAKAIIREGIAEEVLEVQEVAPEVKEEVKPEEKQPEEPKAKPEVKKETKETKEVKPSMDWTHSELLEYGTSKGIEFVEGATKQEMLDLIEGGKK
jgi:outer membrane biosynthesis protein TonB